LAASRKIDSWTEEAERRWPDIESGFVEPICSKALRPSFYDEDNFMSTVNVKKEAKRLIEKLPENVTWDELMHEIYVRQSIEAGLADSEAGKVTDATEVRAKFGLES